MPRGLRPTPSSLRRMRYGARYRWDARFYGLYISRTGRRKRFSFQVKIGSALKRDRRRLSRLIRVTVNSLKDSMVPEHRQGDVFSSFHELIFGTRWFRVRKLVRYEAGLHYER